MKQTIALTVFVFCMASTTAGQRRTTKGASKSGNPQTHKTAPAPAPIIGAQVTVTTKAGEQIAGQVLEIGGYSVRVKQGDLESKVPLESIAVMRFGDAPEPAPAPAPAARGVGADFARDAQSVIASCQAMDAATQSGTEYSDYGRRLVDLRRGIERFVGKYAGSEDVTESRLAALFSAALDDYTWGRTIWTLRLGQGPGATLAASDSPAVEDALELYPDLAQLGPRTKLPADKLVAGLWKQASLKVGRCRRILGEVR